MQDVMICGACEKSQICKLKDEGFIDLCPKRKEVSKVMVQNQPSSKAVQKKEVDGKRKKRQKRKIEDKEQFKLYHDKMI